MNNEFETDFEKEIRTKVAAYGGWVNAHTHLDRANTLNAEYLSHEGMDPIEASSYPV